MAALIIRGDCHSYHHTADGEPQLANSYSQTSSLILWEQKGKNSLWDRRHAYNYRVLQGFLTQTLSIIRETEYM